MATDVNTKIDTNSGQELAENITDYPSVVVKLAGDSGDGIQLAGIQFTMNTALRGNDVEIFPDFPSEIRAPLGTVSGVSGFQIHFGSYKVFTPGDHYDVLVAMNVAAYLANIDRLKKGGTIILNTAGFDAKSHRLAGCEEGTDILSSLENSDYKIISVNITSLTREALSDLGLGVKEMDRSRNMFVLGFLFYLFNRITENAEREFRAKFSKKPIIAEANVRALKAGYNYGLNTEEIAHRMDVGSAKLSPGKYRGITGNKAVALGLITASMKSGLPLFLGSYPITPASEILHELAKYKHYDVITFQAEDEIAAICSSIGASFGGLLGATTTSGPGMDLKTEAIGFAVMVELPLVIVNVQRAGPSTGLPTKTEQADLLQAMFGRHGEAPLPVIAASSPADCFAATVEASRIAIEFMTPVILLSDSFLANGAETWKIPSPDQIGNIFVPKIESAPEDKQYEPYFRDEKGVRQWAIPGTKKLEHRIGGLEKQDVTGLVSHNPINHQVMVEKRKAKIDGIANYIPDAELNSGSVGDKIIVLSWGSSFGAVKLACDKLRTSGTKIAHLHLRYLNPFPKNLREILSGFDLTIVPEMNSGQLSVLIESKLHIHTKGIHHVQGNPFTITNLCSEIKEIIENYG